MCSKVNYALSKVELVKRGSGLIISTSFGVISIIFCMLIRADVLELVKRGWDRETKKTNHFWRHEVIDATSRCYKRHIDDGKSSGLSRWRCWPSLRSIEWYLIPLWRKTAFCFHTFGTIFYIFLYIFYIFLYIFIYSYVFLYIFIYFIYSRTPI